jgi:hypothetical protein
MFKKIALASVFALGVFGCSSTQQDNALHNLLATVCANGQTIMVSLPTGFLTPQQIQNIQLLACSTAFGTTPAPAPAPGNSPVFSPASK